MSYQRQGFYGGIPDLNLLQQLSSGQQAYSYQGQQQQAFQVIQNDII